MGNSEKRSGRGKDGVGVNRVDYDTWAIMKNAGVAPLPFTNFTHEKYTPS